MNAMELIGTKPPVKKDAQVKFYVPAELMRECQEVFDQQGVNLSEGMTRLIRLLVSAPEEMIPVLLGQAQGDASAALARSILDKEGREQAFKFRKASRRKNPPPPPAQ
jgi:hypothetical protein